MLLAHARFALQLPASARPAGRRPALVATLLAAVLLAPAPPVRAGQPLTADDADLLAPQACEWESLAARLNDRQPSPGTAWQTQLSCGALDALELTASVASSPEARQAKRTQVAGLGGKLRLIGSGGSGGSEADDGRPRVAVSFAINMLRLNDAAFEVRDHGINLLASQRLATAWTGHLNLGWTHSRPTHASSLTWKAAVEHALTPAVDVAAESFGDDRGKPWASGGVRWALTPGVAVSASFGVRTGGGTPARLATVGFKVGF